MDGKAAAGFRLIAPPPYWFGTKERAFYMQERCGASFDYEHHSVRDEPCLIG